MKSILLFGALIITYCTASAQQSGQLTQHQKDLIKSEVHAVLDTMFARAERLDADGAFECYSPDLLVVRDSTFRDFHGYKKLWVDTFKQLTVWKWTPYREAYVFISDDAVLCSMVGKVELVFKSGVRLVVDPQGYSDLFKKTDGRWKAIYETAFGVPSKPKETKQ